MFENRKNIWFFLFLWIGILALYYVFFFNRAYVEIDVEVKQRTWFKIYWAGEGQPFSEKRMVRVRPTPDRKKYGFFLTNLKAIERLRIDPHQYKGLATVNSINITQKGVQDIIFNSSEDFSRLEPLDQIQQYSAENGILHVVSNGNDPNFLFVPEIQLHSYSLLEESLRAIGIGIALLIFYLGTSNLIVHFRFVPVCLACVVVLAATMAIISQENAHPDEFVHVPAADYYSDHWLPPEISDDSIRHTYSPYGTSRLNTDEIYYLFCGKFGKFLEPLHLNTYLKYRLFNVALLLCVLMYLFRVPDARIMAIPFLLTPQIWYLFSYCNSDAFALVVAFVSGCQVVLPNSMFNRWLRGSGGMTWLLKVITVAVCFGLLLLIKKNYWPFAAVLGLGVIFNWLNLQDSWEKRVWISRVVVIAVLAVSVWGTKMAANYYVNGPDRAAKIAETRVQLAHPIYNPETPLEKTHTQLYRKAKGDPLSELVVVDRWFEKTFRTAVGVYGYFTISASDVYYDLIRWASLSLLVFIIGSIMTNAGALDRWYLLVVIGMSLLLIAASLNHSWKGDFQTQGRYLLPVLSMLALSVGRNVQILNKRWLSLLIMPLFMLSLYSFIMIALYNIPRLTVS